MNRTQKYTAAGIAVVVILAIIAMVALTPNLHTQTPVSTAPPTTGGKDNGTSGNNPSGTGGGTENGNGTAPNCNATEDDHEWEDQNENDGNWSGNHTWEDHNGTDQNWNEDHPWEDGNGTNETGDHDQGACNGTVEDHDWQGDQESDGHNGQGEDSFGDMVVQDALSAVAFLTNGFTIVWNTLGAAVGLLGKPLAAVIGSGAFL